MERFTPGQVLMLCAMFLGVGTLFCFVQTYRSLRLDRAIKPIGIKMYTAFLALPIVACLCVLGVIEGELIGWLLAASLGYAGGVARLPIGKNSDDS